MPFPIQFRDAEFGTPRSLAMAVMSELRAGRPVHDDLVSLHRTGALHPEESVGLGAALVQTRQPDAVIAGSHLAAATEDASLAELLLLAHDALDMGTLLQSAGDDASVEDVLLTAAAACVHHAGPVLNDLLTRLRNAGLGRQELDLLVRAGTADMLAEALPAILLEGLPKGSVDGLAKAMRRDAAVGTVLADNLKGLAPDERTRLWAAMARNGVVAARPDLVQTLFPKRAGGAS